MVFNLFESEHKKGRGIVMITHDAAAAARAQMVYQLEDGIRLSYKRSIGLWAEYG